MIYKSMFFPLLFKKWASIAYMTDHELYTGILILENMWTALI